MKTRIAFGCIAMMFVLALPTNAGGKEQIQSYFSNAAGKVKATNNPAEKRAILNESIQTMSKALNKVESSGLISQEDRAGILQFKKNLQEKQDELAGTNGYLRVSDDQLNAFSDYVVQDMEQADLVISISLVALILIIILIVLMIK